MQQGPCAPVVMSAALAFSAWLFVGLYMICEHYFVPSLEACGARLGISEDAQGATLLAIGSSTPELFTALIGVLFFTRKNPGPSTNIGSALFNQCVIVGVSALVLPAGMSASLDATPFWRDIVFYLTAIVALGLVYDVITPGQIDVWESAALCVIWIVYVVTVIWRDVAGRRQKQHSSPTRNRRPSVPPDTGAPGSSAVAADSFALRAMETAGAPFAFVFRNTVADPQARDPAILRIFAMSIVWLGFITWVVVEVVEAVANCAGLPPDIIGVTILAVGTSAPDCIGSVIAAKKGKIKMAVSNAIGSNIFDCCLCVGLPFFIESVTTGAPVKVRSAGMKFLQGFLMVVLGVHVAMLWSSGYALARWHGRVFLALYGTFIVFYLAMREGLGIK